MAENKRYRLQQRIALDVRHNAMLYLLALCAAFVGIAWGCITALSLPEDVEAEYLQYARHAAMTLCTAPPNLLIALLWNVLLVFGTYSFLSMGVVSIFAFPISVLTLGLWGFTLGSMSALLVQCGTQAVFAWILCVLFPKLLLLPSFCKTFAESLRFGLAKRRGRAAQPPTPALLAWLLLCIPSILCSVLLAPALLRGLAALFGWN